VLEFASRELSEIEKVGEWLSDGRELGAGLIDVKNFYTDTPEDVAKRIHTALKYVKPEQLWVNPDCGFGWSPRYMCNQKIGALAAGAKLAREQLGK
jgi:5-methyltetrahydropteroyltriglutamate--homocysteine methyltransferase